MNSQCEQSVSVRRDNPQCGVSRAAVPSHWPCLYQVRPARGHLITQMIELMEGIGVSPAESSATVLWQGLWRGPGELPLHSHRQGSFGSHSVLGFLWSREAL